jgi:hypothetical protein
MSVFRIDKFVVPPDALPAFMERVHRIKQMLDPLPGCHQNLVLTQTDGPGTFNVVTIVEWASPQAVAGAQAIVQRQYAAEGFDPSAFMRKLGVRADLGVYASA